MSSNAVPFDIPSRILAEVYHEARGSFPAECCGWLFGAMGSARVSRVRSCINDQASGNHPTVAERTSEAAYVLSGEDRKAIEVFEGAWRTLLLVKPFQGTAKEVTT